MKIFHVYWKETHIGTLYTENGMHKYEANQEKIISLKTEPINPVLEKSKDWGPEIPFFKTRLEANQRFQDLEIGFLTDFVRLREIEI